MPTYFKMLWIPHWLWGILGTLLILVVGLFFRYFKVYPRKRR